MSVRLLAVISGVAFGMWPLLASRSGMKGNPLSMCLLLTALLINVPFALKQGVSLPGSHGTPWMIGSGLVMGAGMLFFNGMLVKAGRNQIASLFILMLVVQIVVPAVWQMMSSSMSSKQLAGIVAAIIAAILLG